MTNVLSFRIYDAVLGINIDNVRWIIDIEEFEEVVFMPPYVYGKITYNNKHYFLISINEKLKLSRYKNIIGKYGIVITLDNNEFVIVVDEILHIKELEQKMSPNQKIPSNMFMEEGKVGEFLNESFFQDIINLKLINSQHQRNKEIEKTINLNLLLFTLHDELFAIETRYIDSVQIIENNINRYSTEKEKYGILQHAEQLIQVLDTKKFFHLPQSEYENVLIISKDNTTIGLAADSIINTFEVPQSNIEEEINKEALFYGYFIYKDRICHIIRPEVLENLLHTNGLKQNRDYITSINVTNNERFLLINDNYAIAIDTVHVIKERQDIELLRTLNTAIGVESFINIGEKNYYLFNLAHLIDKENKDYNFVIALENLESDIVVAIGVDNIVDLIETNSENIFTFQQQGQYFLRGTFDYQNETRKILDMKWLQNYIENKVIA